MMVTPGSARRNRTFSAFWYATLQTLLIPRVQRGGMAVMRVNPAYTSVVGCIKAVPTRGVSIHEGAALVIARRALGFQEATGWPMDQLVGDP